MEHLFITTTSTEGFKPLGSAPQRSYELIVSSLSDPDVALLFAEPVSSQYGDKIDWYSERRGRAKPLAELSEEDQAALKARLSALVDKVRAEAQALSAGDDPDNDSLRLSEALNNALEIPNEDSIYAVVDADGAAQPVLVNWAWIEDRQNVVRGVLTSADTRQKVPPVSPVQTAEGTGTAQTETSKPARGRVARGGAGPSPAWFWLYWLGWLILALLIAAILVLMIAPCGLRVPGLPNFCVVGQAEASAGERRTLILRDQIAILEREIAMKDRACQPDPDIPPFLPPQVEIAPVPVPPVAEPQDHADIDDRLERAGAQVGDLTFSLIWDGPDDLDLEVTCPAGDRLFWGTRQACNGRIDIDTGVGRPSSEPVENIFFQDPLPGEYTVRVTLPTSRSGGAPRPFRLSVRQGDTVQVLEGVVSGRDTEWGHRLQFGGN